MSVTSADGAAIMSSTYRRHLAAVVRNVASLLVARRGRAGVSPSPDGVSGGWERYGGRRNSVHQVDRLALTSAMLGFSVDVYVLGSVSVLHTQQYSLQQLVKMRL